MNKAEKLAYQSFVFSLFISGDKNAVDCYDLPGYRAFSYFNSFLQVFKSFTALL